MRIGPAVHGALLVIVLFLAYRSWTAEEETEVTTGDFVVWNESADAFQSLEFKTDNKEVLVEKRTDETGEYLWGNVTRTRKKVTRPDPHQGMRKPPTPKKDGAAPPDGAKPKGPAKKPGTGSPAKKTNAGKTEKTNAVKKKPANKADGDPKSQNDPIVAQTQPKKAQPAQPKKAQPKKAQPKKAQPKQPQPAQPKQPADPHGHGGHGAPGAGSDEGAGATATPATGAKAETSEVTTTREFPVGEAGEELVEGFSKLRALRELGALNEDDKIEYGLDDATNRLTVRFEGGTEHSLLVGDRVFGGSDRYVLDETSGKGYVLSSDLMRLIDAAETSLGLKDYHAFDQVEDLRRLAVETDDTTTEVVRLDLEEDKGGKTTTRTTWARSDSENIEDVTMANFVDRVSKLRPVEYLPDLDKSELTRLARFSYRDADGKELGYMELYKGPGDEPARPGSPVRDEYYMITEATRVLGRVSRLTAERVDQDLAEIFNPTDQVDEESGDESTPDEQVPPVMVPPR